MKKSMLVGEGAKKWALENNFEEVPNDYLKTGFKYIHLMKNDF